ncbi:MAG: SPOR domain-containing protein [bacterium]
MKIVTIYFILFAGTLFFPQLSFTQVAGSDSGKVEFIQDEKVGLLVSKHITINQNMGTIDGYRVQIFSDSGNNSKTQAQAASDGFVAKYPNVNAYLTFKSPNYRVRVGDFRSRLDAQRFLSEITDDYPNAFIISDNINLPKVE